MLPSIPLCYNKKRRAFTMCAKIREKTEKDNKSISISDVAKAAGVALGTASRVFNGCDNVDEKLKKQVWLAARKAGYIPKKRSKCVGIVCGRRSPAAALRYVTVMSSLLTDAFMSKGFSVELIDIEHLELAYQTHVNGIVGVVFDDRLAELAKIPNLPVIAANANMIASGVHSIYADHFEQGYMAAEHFIRNGHRTAGFLALDPMESGCAARIKGCLAAMRDNGLPESSLEIKKTGEENLYDILRRWVERDIKAIFNFSEDSALEAIHIISNVLNLKIGKDISMISVEDIPIYKFMNPPQTVIRQPLEEITALAAEKLIELMENPSSTVFEKVLHSKLIDRDSVCNLN